MWRGLVAQVIIACLDTTKADANDFIEAAKDLGVFLGDSFIDLVSCVEFSVGLPDAAKATADPKQQPGQQGEDNHRSIVPHYPTHHR